MQQHIRNFCIIAHIDHGKSTLADRLLELTGTIDKRQLKEQTLDTMELEQERGITIKLQPARMRHTVDGQVYTLNLIDTPGHVDFSYEVSRSLAAVEGCLLLVDATQGVQAQTLANLYLAMDYGLEVIPVLNKIDLPAADVEARGTELMQLIGCKREEILAVSGKTGEGVPALLDAIVAHIPVPKGDSNAPTRALIFDSLYDDYQGVIAYVRVVDGALKTRDALHFMATGADGMVTELGHLLPSRAEDADLSTGQIGYVVTGLKELSSCHVGDTVTIAGSVAKALPGYRVVVPMVFAGIFPKDGGDAEELREAMERLMLSDASISVEPERSAALGVGFRCGLLGMLHLEIVQERLKRESGVEVVVTTPSVAYRVRKTNGTEMRVTSPQDLPDPSHIESIFEPWVRTDIVVPSVYVGAVMSLVQDRGGLYKTTEYLDAKRALLHYELPLSAVIVDFHDALKTVTSGYGSLNYELLDEREASIVRLDILVAEDPVEALATFVYRDKAHQVGKRIVHALMEEIPRQQFVVKIQAAVGGKIVAGDKLSALRKDVTAKLYGGDVTRKRKLLEKQKKGKKRMAAMGHGRVEIPSKAYLRVLKQG
ncbi:elongation factor 4 [Candidatus Uhrbacteria bacterium RIFCSPLOWO2_01_FULL_53_9]|uniref:Elongation factor 4 n=3 Tax=Candidatus Uhriibacteriota TaxID=1752732 RepID=A0A1F7UYV7_9BACT|nr:MAG: elongation factor 4 [Candidatus Uhrbacteria bacterium RIFCSPHIGHO2_02_FULL_53_13]OGL83462.1 MAG: elongation factor 4 [Candidatus Uhrbacteria bacterium RIFCSPLOWO2_01_FULL_53_9]OGL89496.1 MAG: elongation factor 4 [Candidatus Uhrbacteria bacterium RIFCSPLOWO2_02_FULL_53_10]